MKILPLYLTATLAILVFGISNVSGLIVPSPFNFGTDKTEYNKGETVKISGIIADEIIKPNQTITIDIFDPDGNLYKNVTVDPKPQKPSSNGFYNYGYNFEYLLKIENDTKAGPYQLVFHYGKSLQGSKTIMFDTGNIDYDRYFVFNAFLTNVTQHIRYKVTQGIELEGFGIDAENKILYINAINTRNEVGNLTVELPRNIIDSQYASGSDKNYATAIGVTGMMISGTNNFTEIQTNGQNRTLEFGIPSSNASYTIILHGTSINQNKTMLHQIISPLKQFKLGIAKNVKCIDDLTLVIKAEDGSPACVKPDTANILIERGWAKALQ